MKKIFIICLIIFFVSGILLTFVIAGNYSVIKEKFSEGSVYINSHKKIIAIEKLFSEKNDKININIIGGDIVIEPYTGKDIAIKTVLNQKNIKKIDINEKDGVIIINGEEVEELRILVPNEKFLNAEIKIAAGNLQAENIKNAIIAIGNGDFMGKNIDKLNSLEIIIGDAKIENVSNISSIKIGKGDLSLSISDQNNNFFIQNNSGDIKLSISNKFDGVIDVETKMGDIVKKNLNINGSLYKGVIELNIGDINLEGVDYYDKKIN